MILTSQDAKTERGTHQDWLNEPLDGLSLELGRISAEIQSINAGFQNEIQLVVANVRDAIQNEYRIRFEKSVEEMREQMRAEAALELQARLDEERTRMETRLEEEQNRIQTEASRELQTRLLEERNQLETRFQEERNQIRVETTQELQTRFEEELANRIERLGGVQKEIDAAAVKLQAVTTEIAVMLDDPNIELSKIIRKRAEEAELKAYIDGLRFIIAK
jgi:DNA anti-recombination protein RmuC